MIILHELLCMALFYSIFCRAVWMRSSTRRDVRFVLLVMGSVAAIGMAMPLHRLGWRPDWFTLALLASITAVQWVTASYWRQGVPTRFSKPHRGAERRHHDRRETQP